MEEDIKILIEENPTWKKEKAIKNLRNLIKRNKELEEFKKQVTEIESTNFIKYKNYIPKQKVIDKIEELGLTDTEIIIKEVLQELLEEGEK